MHATHLPEQLRHVIVFVPFIEVDGALVSPHYDLPEYRAEIAGWMNALGLSWDWTPVTARTLPALLDNARIVTRDGSALVMNLCDGSESDGYPGLEVVQGLADLDIPFTGSDADFYRITTSKALMKRALMARQVSAAPFVLIRDFERDLARAATHVGFPMFIKPDVSAGSYGIQIDSVCRDLDAARRKVTQLQQGMHGQQFGDSGILAERFIEGREFTVLVVEDAHEPMGLWVLPPGERVFDKRVPPRERFLAFERYWGLPEAQRPLPPGEPYYWYEQAPDALRARLSDLARRAMRAVGGCGYGRVDIRMEDASDTLHVLEVNAQCGLSSDDSSTVGSMLRLSGESIVDVIARVLRHGLERAETSRLQAQPDSHISASHVASGHINR